MSTRSTIPRIPISRKPPQTAFEAAEFIAQMKRETKSRAARVRMAELAISFGDVTDEARSVWTAYLIKECGV